MKNIKLMSPLLLLLSSYAVVAHADPESNLVNKGFEISQRSEQSDTGFSDSRAEALMILTNRKSKTIERSLEFLTLESSSDTEGDKSLVIFNSPKDIKGTVLLTHAKIKSDDDQWIFLPSLKRVKRIASSNKSGPFVGSEFAFEDFTINELHNFNYKFVTEDTVNGMKMDVIDRFPQYEKSGYSKQRSWIDQEIYQPRKVEFYSLREELLKTLTFSDFKEYEGGVWRAHKLNMENHLTGKKTDLIYSDFEFKTDLKENDFSQGALKRIR